MGILFNSEFDEKLDKATSELLPEATEDIQLNMEIADMIKAKKISPKEVMRSIRKKLNSKNPNVQLLTLKLLDVCTKNGGNHFVVEIASKDFVDNLLLINENLSINLNVRRKILEFLQIWALAFKNKVEFGYLWEKYSTLKSQGYNFPPTPQIFHATFHTTTAPKWIDLPECTRCRSPFGMTVRKHHCRNCGKIFCQTCSSKTCHLPHYGLNEHVRVCDACYQMHSQSIEKPSRDDEDFKRAIKLSINQSKIAASSQPFNESEDSLLKAALAESLKEYQNYQSKSKQNTSDDGRRIVKQTENKKDSPLTSSDSALPTSIPTHQTSSIISPSWSLSDADSVDLETFANMLDRICLKGVNPSKAEGELLNSLYFKMKSIQEKLLLIKNDIVQAEKEQILLLERSKIGLKAYEDLLDQRITFIQNKAFGGAGNNYSTYTSSSSVSSSTNPLENYQQQQSQPFVHTYTSNPYNQHPQQFSPQQSTNQFAQPHSVFPQSTSYHNHPKVIQSQIQPSFPVYSQQLVSNNDYHHCNNESLGAFPGSLPFQQYTFSQQYGPIDGNETEIPIRDNLANNHHIPFSANQNNSSINNNSNNNSHHQSGEEISLIDL